MIIAVPSSQSPYIPLIASSKRAIPENTNKCVPGVGNGVASQCRDKISVEFAEIVMIPPYGLGITIKDGKYPFNEERIRLPDQVSRKVMTILLCLAVISTLSADSPRFSLSSYSSLLLPKRELASLSARVHGA